MSNFNTENVTTMEEMFRACTSLEKLNLYRFNTQNVTDMSKMFYSCSKLKKLSLSNFNSEKVTRMSYMFSECGELQELNILYYIFLYPHQIFFLVYLKKSFTIWLLSITPQRMDEYKNIEYGK